MNESRWNQIYDLLINSTDEDIQEICMSEIHLVGEVAWKDYLKQKLDPGADKDYTCDDPEEWYS